MLKISKHGGVKTVDSARDADAALVRAVRQGDAGAFGALFRRWHPKLLRHAFNILREREAAQDAVQDAWADIHAGLARLNEPSLFGVWCFRIVTRKCNRIIRGKYRSRRIARDLAAEPDVREDETSDVTLEMRAGRPFERSSRNNIWAARKAAHVSGGSIGPAYLPANIAGSAYSFVRDGNQKTNNPFEAGPYGRPNRNPPTPFGCGD